MTFGNPLISFGWGCSALQHEKAKRMNAETARSPLFAGLSLGALGEIRTSLLRHSDIKRFSLQFGPRDKSRGRAEWCLWANIFRQDSRATYHKCRISARRRLLTVLLAVAYLLVGFGTEISCAEETLAINSSFDVSAVADKSGEGYVPLVIPAPVLVAEPSAEPVKVSFEAPTFLLEDHPGLDTPPPKRLA